MLDGVRERVRLGDRDRLVEVLRVASGRAPGRRSPRCAMVISGVTLGEDGRAEEVALGVRRRPCRLRPSRSELGPLASRPSRCTPSDALLVPRADDRAHRHARLHAVADLHLLERLGEQRLSSSRVRLADADDDAQWRGTAAPRSPTRCRRCSRCVLSQSQSSITTLKFFAPPSACTRLPVAPQRCVDVLGDRRSSRRTTRRRCPCARGCRSRRRARR